MPAGFDVSKFISPFRGDLLEGWSGASAVSTAASNRLAEQTMAMKERENRMAMARLQEEEAMKRALEAQGGMDRRMQAGLAFKQAQADQELEQSRLGESAKLVAEARDAFARGDETAMATIKAKAALLDPMLQMGLPGEGMKRVDPSIPALDEAYPVEGGPQLEVSRGGQTLLQRGAGEEKQFQMDKLGSFLHPLQQSPYAGAYQPALDAGMNTVGRGMSADDLLKPTVAQANKEADRLAMDERAAKMAASKATSTEDTKSFRMQDQIGKLEQRVDRRYKVTDARKVLDDTDLFRGEIESGIPFAQNEAMLMRIGGMIKGAASDRDMEMAQSSAGKLNSVQRSIGMWLNGGELPDDFKNQVLDALDIIRDATDDKLMRAGIAARDSVYGATFLPFENVDDVARAGAEVFGNITGKILTPEEIAAEASRLRKTRGRAQLGSARRSTRTATSESFVLPADIGPLGGPLQTTPRRGVPKIPLNAPAEEPDGKNDPKVLELLGE